MALTGIPANPTLSAAMDRLAKARDIERAAEVRLSGLLFGGNPYTTEEHIAACSALEAARAATQANTLAAAAAVFTQMCEPEPVISSAPGTGAVLAAASAPASVRHPAPVRRSSRLAASASTRAAKAAEALKAEQEIDAIIGEEDISRRESAFKAARIAKYETLLAKYTDEHRAHTAAYNNACVHARIATDDLCKNSTSAEHHYNVRYYAKSVCIHARKIESYNNKIATIQAAIADITPTK
jgi:hypothetical protein